MRLLGLSALILPVILEASASQRPPEASASRSECRRAAELPAHFPFDAYVLRARVVEPVSPLDTAVATGLGWVVQVEPTTPIHVPENRRQFDLLLQTDDCASLSRQELIDRFVSGDQLEIAAFAGTTRGLLVTPGDWVRLMDENTSRGIDTPFEYFAALFDLEGRENDSQRALGLRRIASYVSSEEQFIAVVDAYIDGKRLRKQLRTMYRDIHAK